MDESWSPQRPWPEGPAGPGCGGASKEEGPAAKATGGVKAAHSSKQAEGAVAKHHGRADGRATCTSRSLPQSWGRKSEAGVAGLAPRSREGASAPGVPQLPGCSLPLLGLWRHHPISAFTLS